MGKRSVIKPAQHGGQPCPTDLLLKSELCNVYSTTCAKYPPAKLTRDYRPPEPPVTQTATTTSTTTEVPSSIVMRVEIGNLVFSRLNPNAKERLMKGLVTGLERSLGISAEQVITSTRVGSTSDHSVVVGKITVPTKSQADIFHKKLSAGK